MSTLFIPINIWDDFYDDGHVPAGEKQDTHAYVEDYDMDEGLKQRVLQHMAYYIKRLAKFANITVEYRHEPTRINQHIIYFEPITHELLDWLMDYFKGETLEFEGYTLRIYSES